MAVTVPIQHRTLSEEGFDVASYLVGYGGSGHTYALHLHSLSLWVLKFYVGLKVNLMSIVLFICRGGLITVYHVLYFMKILLDILHNVIYFFMESHCINNLIINLFSYAVISFILDRCLINL